MFFVIESNQDFMFEGEVFTKGTYFIQDEKTARWSQGFAKVTGTYVDLGSVISRYPYAKPLGEFQEDPKVEVEEEETINFEREFSEEPISEESEAITEIPEEEPDATSEEVVEDDVVVEEPAVLETIEKILENEKSEDGELKEDLDDDSEQITLDDVEQLMDKDETEDEISEDLINELSEELAKE